MQDLINFPAAMLSQKELTAYLMSLGRRHQRQIEKERALGPLCLVLYIYKDIRS